MNKPTITWSRGCVKLIDQTKLPVKLEYIYCRNVETLWEAIRRLSVRGAPALGVAAAFGVLLGSKTFQGRDRQAFAAHIQRVSDYLATARPTAVNLFHGLDRMKKILEQHPEASVAELKKRLRQEAFAVYEEDRRVCRAMGRHGAALIQPKTSVMTICNAGALATVDYGTALGVMYAAKEEGKPFHVYACETRPLLQGARLTAWELCRAGIDTTLICDSMAANVLRDKSVSAVFTGADRIARNGDSANKIGTYGLAVLAKYHRVPFYIVAPYSTFDMGIASGKDIPIEERDRREVAEFAGLTTAPKKVKVFNPAFDVTPHTLISGIVTERGVIHPPFQTNIRKMFKV